VSNEFEARVAARNIEPSLSKQAEALADWFKSSHPTVQPYTAKTIRNRLKERYWATQKSKADVTSK